MTLTIWTLVILGVGEKILDLWAASVLSKDNFQYPLA